MAPTACKSSPNTIKVLIVSIRDFGKSESVFANHCKVKQGVLMPVPRFFWTARIVEGDINLWPYLSWWDNLKRLQGSIKMIFLCEPYPSTMLLGEQHDEGGAHSLGTD